MCVLALVCVLCVFCARTTVNKGALRMALCDQDEYTEQWIIDCANKWCPTQLVDC